MIINIIENAIKNAENKKLSLLTRVISFVIALVAGVIGLIAFSGMLCVAVLVLTVRYPLQAMVVWGMFLLLFAFAASDAQYNYCARTNAEGCDQVLGY